jgi:hypothetical protein
MIVIGGPPTLSSPPDEDEGTARYLREGIRCVGWHSPLWESCQSPSLPEWMRAMERGGMDPLAAEKIRLPIISAAALLLQTDYERRAKDSDVLETAELDEGIRRRLPARGPSEAKLAEMIEEAIVDAYRETEPTSWKPRLAPFYPQSIPHTPHSATPSHR